MRVLRRGSGWQPPYASRFHYVPLEGVLGMLGYSPLDCPSSLHTRYLPKLTVQIQIVLELSNHKKGV